MMTSSCICPAPILESILENTGSDAGIHPGLVAGPESHGMFLGSWRKPENPDKTHTDTRRCETLQKHEPEIRIKHVTIMADHYLHYPGVLVPF